MESLREVEFNLIELDDQVGAHMLGVASERWKARTTTNRELLTALREARARIAGWEGCKPSGT